MANVSRTTVSRFLNESGYVSEEARKRILKVIDETGYVPSVHAKSLRTKKTKVIGVILPTIKTETSGRIVSGIDKKLAKYGYQILLVNTNLNKEKEVESLSLLKARQVDGLILVATNVATPLINKLHEINIPLVVIGQEIEGFPNVLFNDYGASKDILARMLKDGHERIAFIGVDEEDKAVGYMRKKAYLDSLKEHHLQMEPTWIQKGVFDFESGYEAMERIMTQSSQKPTALFAVTDRLAIGAMRYLKEQNYKVPHDVAIASIGGSEISQYVDPRLTTVDYQNDLAGEAAAKQLLSVISKQEPLASDPIVLDYKICYRESL